MLDKDALFVLGAQDPEMREIARVLRQEKRGYFHATQGGVLVRTRSGSSRRATIASPRPTRGQCPGVDPNELLFLRASWRARMSGRSLGDVVEGIHDAAKRVRRHFDSEHGESCFLDPTGIPLDLAEGAAVAGCPIRYREFFPNGDLKEMLKGGPPAHIERFMAMHRDAGREVYGNPYRGYAGAYLQ